MRTLPENLSAVLLVADEMLDCRSLLRDTDLEPYERAELEFEMRDHAETIWAYLQQLERDPSSRGLDDPA